ncbi:hypothetical protein JAAARDRAFT_38366 [Jaapia argillacea MUCL 33604]|uniref:Cation/H+ exchanger transmembrane domain-containing protein n=1 Tax=Jaapia argillacea MUCL 33604 TaxID=933084 RepID=A0A067PTS9_9AGAM|nr:hypothetical protein JAAARDRAFT_38366 [Jaapia argillacea MUCL 33604]
MFSVFGTESVVAPEIVLLVLGGVLILFGLTSNVIKSYYLSETLLMTLIGIALGPKGLDVLRFVDPGWESGDAENERREVLMWFTRIIIGVQVLSAAATLPSRYLLQRDNVKSLTTMLLPLMTTSWLVSSLLVQVCLPNLRFAESLIIGACVAPTDPVLANAVVKGAFAENHVPNHIRELLAAESGINDGFGTPFLFLPLSFILNGYHPIPSLRYFFLHTILRDVVFSILLGTGLGYVARKSLKNARKLELIDRESMLVFSIALALFTIGVGRMLGTNELLACFFAGTAVNWTDKIRSEDLHSHFSEGIELFFDCSVFIVLGTILPWDSWLEPDVLPFPRLILLAFAILLLRRLPITLLLTPIIPQIKTMKEALFVGHFGPIGIGALYYTLIALEELPEEYESRDKTIPVVTFIILMSIVVHGSSAPLIMLARKVPYQWSSGAPTPVNHPVEIEANEQSEEDSSASVGTLPTERDPLLPSNRRKPRSIIFDDEDTEPISREVLDEVAQSIDRLPSSLRYPSMGDPDSHRHRIASAARLADASGNQASFRPSLRRGRSETVLRDAARVTVYDEGDYIVFDDAQGRTIARRVRSGSRAVQGVEGV